MDSANTSNPTNDYVGAGFKSVFQNIKTAPAPEPVVAPVTTPPPLGATTAPFSPTPITTPAPQVAPTPTPVVSSLGMPPPPSPEVTSFVSSTDTKPKKEKKSSSGKSPVIIVLLLILMGGLVVSFGKVRSFISGAAGTCTPDNLTEANLTSDSIEVVFQTGKACQAEVAYGVSSQALLLQIPETMATLSHRIRLTPLLPSTTYYYQVVAGGEKVGTVRSFLTKAPVTAVPTEEPEIPTAIEQVIPTAIVTAPPVVPTQAASSSAAVKTYTYEDFKTEFGGTNPTFDIDKNGAVNRADWLLYQK